jgi:hypothetical protein
MIACIWMHEGEVTMEGRGTEEGRKSRWRKRGREERGLEPRHGRVVPYSGPLSPFFVGALYLTPAVKHKKYFYLA